MDLVPLFIQTGIDQERVGIRRDDECGVTLADIQGVICNIPSCSGGGLPSYPPLPNSISQYMIPIFPPPFLGR